MISTCGKYTFFWQNKSPFSNWYPAIFYHKGLRFTSSEQAMMWEKAMVFGDTDMADKILATNDPRTQKDYGRQIKNYDDTVWSKVRYELVYEIVKNKFIQNPKLLRVLLSTGDTTIVEASPYDKIWGIGMSEDNPDVADESKWLGMNLLGKALTEFRNKTKTGCSE